MSGDTITVRLTARPRWWVPAFKRAAYVIAHPVSLFVDLDDYTSWCARIIATYGMAYKVI